MDVALSQGFGQRCFRKAFTPGHRQFPHIEYDVNIGFFQCGQKIIQRGTLIPDCIQAFHTLRLSPAFVFQIVTKY